MKKFLILLLALLLLAGCGNDMDPTQPPTDPTDPTEPPKPWTETEGMPWDADGVLLEMPLTIPDGMHYNVWEEFDGDLLLWSMDTHLADRAALELCLVELDDGTVIAQRDIECSEYVFPQMLGEYLYIHDAPAGRIIQLNKKLETVKEWTIEPVEGTLYMGAGEKYYHLTSDSRLLVHDLATGQSAPALEGDPNVSWIMAYDGYLTMDYYRSDTGAKVNGVLDLYTGELAVPEMDGYFDTALTMNGDWLCGKYFDGYMFNLSVDGGPALRISGSDCNFNLLPEGYLLSSATDIGTMGLYDLEGRLVSAACVYANGDGYPEQDLIWNEALGGYFLEARSYDETGRLLFWDIRKSAEGEDLTLTEIPAPDEVESRLRERAREIGEKYGLTVLVGSECETVFDEFTATQIADWDRVTVALDTLEEALAAYPAEFIRQLRYGSIQGIQIHLVCDLLADGSGRYGDGYAAFTQARWDNYLMVMDIDDTYTQTYYHEFSHIIDSYLEWDAGQREGALFSEDEWAALNPSWFTGYSYDYSQEHELRDFRSFVDGYSTIKPTEDRARVMEYAMAGYDWTFEDAPGLRSKLDYYCRCIRDAFDTTGWPETTLWEELLP